MNEHHSLLYHLNGTWEGFVGEYFYDNMNRVIEQLYKEVLINDGNTSFKNYQYAIYRYNKNVYIIMKVISDEPLDVLNQNQ